MVRFMYSHLTQNKFQVYAGGFTSDEWYGGGDRSFGSGQGGGALGSKWVLNQDFINRALEAADSRASIIRHPITHEIETNNRIVFADDLNQVSMDSTRTRSDAENLECLRKAAQLNNDCLRASGGSSNIQNVHSDIFQSTTKAHTKMSQTATSPSFLPPTAFHNQLHVCSEININESSEYISLQVLNLQHNMTSLNRSARSSRRRLTTIPSTLLTFEQPTTSTFIYLLDTRL